MNALDFPQIKEIPVSIDPEVLFYTQMSDLADSFVNTPEQKRIQLMDYIFTSPEILDVTRLLAYLNYEQITEQIGEELEMILSPEEVDELADLASAEIATIFDTNGETPKGALNIQRWVGRRLQIDTSAHSSWKAI